MGWVRHERHDTVRLASIDLFPDPARLVPLPHAHTHASEYVLAAAARPRMATKARADLRNMAEACGEAELLVWMGWDRK